MLESRRVLQALSSWQRIDILNTVCAVWPSSGNTAATAELETAMTSFLRILSTGCIARTVNVIPMPHAHIENTSEGVGNND